MWAEKVTQGELIDHFGCDAVGEYTLASSNSKALICRLYPLDAHPVRFAVLVQGRTHSVEFTLADAIEEYNKL